MGLGISVKGPSERELRRKIEQAALREARREHPGREIVIDRRSLAAAARAIHRAMGDFARKLK